MDLTQLQTLVDVVHFERLPIAIVIFIVGTLLARGVSRGLDNLGERFTDRRLMFKQAAVISRFAIYFLLVAILSSSVIELSPQTLLALSGICLAGLMRRISAPLRI